MDKYQDAIAYLYGLQKHGIKLGLKTPLHLLYLLGDPHQGLKTIHVAGTNGKGSTAASIASMLTCAGFKTGLFTSPHLIRFTERITVDGVEISPYEAAALANKLKELSKGINPTFFEVVTVMGLLHFKKSEVDWAVIETGMGGRLDATNVIKPKVSIITSLGMDHKDFLGNTPKEIAFEKCGIIKSGVPAVAAMQTQRQMKVIRGRALETGSELYVQDEDFSYVLRSHDAGGILFDYASENSKIRGIKMPLPGAYQAQNASLAIKAFELATGLTGKSLSNAVKQGLKCLRWQGRLQQISNDPPTYIDAAHNAEASSTLAKTLKQDFLGRGRKLVLVLGAMSDKDLDGIVGPLLPLSCKIIFTAPKFDRAAKPEALYYIAKKMGYDSTTSKSVKDALNMAQAEYCQCVAGGTDCMILITGSFYTIGEALEASGQKGFLTGLRECNTST